MTYQNAQRKNSGNDEGDVLKFFQSKLRNLIAYNGGDHSFSSYTEDVDDKDAPMSIGTKTKIKWTHSGHTISQMEKNSCTQKVDFYVQLNKTLTLDDDVNELNRIFIGFKHGIEFLRDGRLWVDNVMIKEYQQDELIRESFAYNSIKPIDLKEPAKNRFSLWENTSKMSPSMCGAYVPLKLLADGQVHTVSFEITFYLIDQLAFQAWRLYPNSICGEIEEEVITSAEALVWHQIQPSVVKEIEELLNCSTIDQQVPEYVTISNKFSQIGSPATIVTEYKKDTVANSGSYSGYLTHPILGEDAASGSQIYYKTEEVILNVRGGMIQQMRSDLHGFGLKSHVLEGLIKELQTPLVIPSQQLVREGFQGLATSAGLDVSKSIALNNATNITVMFPKRSNEITCFDNIMYQNVQLTINNIKYPDTEFDSTIGSRFYQYQLLANELDGALRPTHELEDSWTMPLNDLKTGERYKGTIRDGTSFCINFQLERTNAGYVFDGIDTGGNTVTIKFKGQPMFRGDNDTYYNFDPNNLSLNPPSPEMWICTDTYFTWAIKSIKYFNTGVPSGAD